MSIVIATREYFFSDRRVTTDGFLEPPTTKIFRNKMMVVGVVGTLNSVINISDRVHERGIHIHPEHIRMALDDESEAVFFLGGQLWRSTSMASYVTKSRYVALGSGSDIAHGYIFSKPQLGRATLRGAVKCACALRTDCGDGIRMMSTGYSNR